jgi:(1->4)-alpha-D-glucan 1-alpha-D-glucosylmutase
MPEQATEPALPPRATYRLQFHKDFTFRDALEIVDYLAELGISHVYASPILAARPGSTHGYDIVDHNSLNPELGTPEEFEALVAALHAHGMGLVVDIVPNHMGVGGTDNAWWFDVLEWGEDSPYAAFFDIDWKTNRDGFRGKVLIPVLGDQYGKVLEDGDIKLAFDLQHGTFVVSYFDHRFPIDPRHYERILDRVGDRAPEPLRMLIGSWHEVKDLKPASDAYGRAQKLKQATAELAANDDAAAERLVRTAGAFNGTPGDGSTWMDLHALIEEQSYRPAYWRVAADEINYRRFFNINDLAGIRVEQREVFEETHRLVFRLVEDGKVQGLRIDHIDGLFDPQEYCERVQARAGRPGRPAYVIVEKILAWHEELPTTWPIAGTSGYDTLNLINGVFVDPAGESHLDRFYRRYTSRDESFDQMLYESKKRIMQVNLASEMNVLANELHRLSSRYLPTRDFTLRGVRDAIEELFAYLPVYRTYVTPNGTSESDRRYIDWAVGRAKRNSQAADTSIFDFLRTVLTGDLACDAGYKPDEVFRVAMKAQQVSGPVMAKGMEDTAFYRYFRLLSLNEVGGDPRRFGVSSGEFHRANHERLERWPLAMLASSTHDTKRGEDARARLNVLSEIPGEWARVVLAWTRMNRSRRGEVDGAPVPEPNHEYLFYQTLVGAWPLDLDPDDAERMRALAERVGEFMQKALREGKERSSWGNPNASYEEAVSRFVDGALQASPTNPFPAALAEFLNRWVARPGAINSLSQTLLKLTMPGVSDTYRGSELWDFSLVDPDNRRPVDYKASRRLLDDVRHKIEGGPAQSPDIRADALREWATHWRDGREKLFLIREVLRFRQRHPGLLARAEYDPLQAEGERAEYVCAFARRLRDETIIVVVPRLSAALRRAAGASGTSSPWGMTTLLLPEGVYRDLLTCREFDGGQQSVQEILGGFPVALLHQVNN